MPDERWDVAWSLWVCASGRVQVQPIEVQYGGTTQTWSSGVHIKKCRYMEQTACAGICTNLCKARLPISAKLRLCPLEVLQAHSQQRRGLAAGPDCSCGGESAPVGQARTWDLCSVVPSCAARRSSLGQPSSECFRISYKRPCCRPCCAAANAGLFHQHIRPAADHEPQCASPTPHPSTPACPCVLPLSQRKSWRSEPSRRLLGPVETTSAMTLQAAD